MMKYRRFGSLDWQVSVLGFSASRLPRWQDGSNGFDETQAIRMTNHALEQGINYVDIGYPYHFHEQEQICGIIHQALQQGYRDDVIVAVTLPAELIESIQNLDCYLHQYLAWLHVDHIDFCLLGNLNRWNWQKLQGLNVLDWAEKAIDTGRIRHLGFSFHDHFQILKGVIGAYSRWSFCQFRYSYMDVDHNPGTSGLRYAAEQGLGIIATETLRSGRLAKLLPPAVQAIWNSSSENRSPAEWALLFAWNNPAVGSVLDTVDSIEQLAEHVALTDRADAESLSIQEEVLISRVKEAFLMRRVIPCPACRPCLPCPMRIDIPRIFEIYNEAVMYDDFVTAQKIYCDEGHQVPRCVECEACMQRCTKRFPIIDLLREAHQMLCADN